MGISKKLAYCVFVVLCLVVATSQLAQGAITCGEVATKLQPCLGYMRSGGSIVPPSCCGGIKALNGEAKTTPDRQQVCKCVKSASTSIPGLNFGYASSLGSKCGVNIPFKVGPNADCSKIK